MGGKHYIIHLATGKWNIRGMETTRQSWDRLVRHALEERTSLSLALSLSLCACVCVCACAHERGDDFNEIGVNNVIIKT